MAHFQQYEMHGVKYVHCGDDFWRLCGKNGMVNQHARKFTAQDAVESFIKRNVQEMEEEHGV